MFYIFPGISPTMIKNLNTAVYNKFKIQKYTGASDF